MEPPPLSLNPKNPPFHFRQACSAGSTGGSKNPLCVMSPRLLLVGLLFWLGLCSCFGGSDRKNRHPILEPEKRVILKHPIGEILFRPRGVDLDINEEPVSGVPS